ncbi:MAG: dihydrodipicolinate synthase family protein [Alphaproteobacteria bacterium]|nr:dihydrodipicolinate synthase family protein [Alphaproteobacteria bacterium]
MPRFDLKQFAGVVPALITPFDETERFDEARLRSCINFLIARNIDGLYTTGSTGEAFLMSHEERKRVVEVVADEVAGRIPVIAHVGAIGTHLSVDLAEHAQGCGVDGLSAVPPFYWKFTPDQVFDYYNDLTGATDLPMIVYNLPLAGLLGFDQIERLAGISGVKGIKYTAPTHAEIMRIKHEIGADFLVFSGADEMAMSGLGFGADGLIGSFYNMMPEVFIALNRAMAEGDLKTARRLQETANTIIFFALARSPTAVIKRAMAWQGADAGYCRKPFENFFGAAEEEKLKADFRQLKKDKNLKGVAFLDLI